MSSFIFTIVHFANLIMMPHLVLGTINQVIYTFALGMALGVAYYKSASLVAVIIAHACFNFLGSLTLIFSEPIAPSQLPKVDISPLSAMIQLGVMLPGIIVALIIYKKANKA